MNMHARSGLSPMRRPTNTCNPIHQFIPLNANKHPDVIFNNVSKQVKTFFARGHHESIGNPLENFLRVATLYLGLREHHNCLHGDKSTTSLEHCHECIVQLVYEIEAATEELCGQLNEAREKEPETFRWEDKAHEFEDENMAFFIEQAVPCKDPLSHKEPPKPIQQQRQPSPSPSESQSTTSSNSSRRSQTKKTTPKRRLFEPNPPSLIITRIKDKKLLGPSRSHFQQAWNDLCTKVFPFGNIPRKFSFDNINVVEQHRSSITISFTERPKFRQLEDFVQQSQNNQWGFVSIFNPHHKNKYDSPHKSSHSSRKTPPNFPQPKQTFSSAAPSRRQKRPIFTQQQPQYMPYTPPMYQQQQQSFNTFQHVNNPTLRRLTNLELKLDYFIQLLSQQAHFEWT